MPPPLWVVRYRGYELVRWFEDGPVDVNHKGEYIYSERNGRVAAELVVDGWLDAP